MFHTIRYRKEMIKMSFNAMIDHLHVMYKKSPDNMTKILILGDQYGLNFM